MSAQEVLGYYDILADWEEVRVADAHTVVGHLRIAQMKGELVAAKIWRDQVNRMVVALWMFGEQSDTSTAEILDASQITDYPVVMAKNLLRIRLQGYVVSWEEHPGWTG